jgi:hypothetical protein
VVEGLDDAGALVEIKPNRGKAAMRRGQYDLNSEPRSPLHASRLAVDWRCSRGILRIGESAARKKLYPRARAAIGGSADVVRPAPAAPGGIIIAPHKIDKPSGYNDGRSFSLIEPACMVGRPTAFNEG